MFSVRVSLGLCSLLLTASMAANAADATGYVPFQCPYTGWSHLHLQKLKGRQLRPEITLAIPEKQFWEHLDDKWYDSPGLDCSDGECQRTTHSKVQVLHFSRSLFMPFRIRRLAGISGNLVVELSDGRKIGGSFRAKLRPPPKGSRCE
jgi:hypothetical protein